MRAAVTDIKIKTAAGKIPMFLIPFRWLWGMARVFAYGAKKYALGNFFKATLADGAGERYMSAMMRHATAMQNPDGTVTPASLAALDDESGLPHIDHILCGMVMLRSIMVKDGALAADPGVGNEPPPAVSVKPVSTLPVFDAREFARQCTDFTEFDGVPSITRYAKTRPGHPDPAPARDSIYRRYAK